MGERIQYRSGFSYNTVSTATVFKALHSREGGIVYEYFYFVCVDIARVGKKIAPENNPLNALHPGHLPPGVYKNSFTPPLSGPGSNQHQTMLVVRNDAPHAQVVEFGKPYVRARQVFSWAHAVNSAIVNGHWKITGPNPGGIVSTKQVHSWKTSRTTKGFMGVGGGHHTMEEATRIVLKKKNKIRVRRMSRGFVRV